MIDCTNIHSFQISTYRKIKMKCAIFICCLFVTVYGLSDEFQEKLLTKLAGIAEQCLPETGATDDDVGEIMEHKLPSKRTGKCLIACFSKKMGMMKDGKFDKDGAMAALEDVKAEDAELYNKFKQVTEKCATEMEKETESDECEYAVKIAVCHQKVSKEMGIDMDSMMR